VRQVDASRRRPPPEVTAGAVGEEMWACAGGEEMTAWTRLQRGQKRRPLGPRAAAEAGRARKPGGRPREGSGEEGGVRLEIRSRAGDR
jgi:hypothetical protein